MPFAILQLPAGICPRARVEAHMERGVFGTALVSRTSEARTATPAIRTDTQL